MLLASSITPSGRDWAQESARASVPGATFIDGVKVVDESEITELARWISVTGASIVSPDLTASLTSVRSLAMLVALWDRSQVSSAPVVAWFPGSVASSAADLQALTTLIHASGSLDLDDTAVARVHAASDALERGLIELVLACPPEPSAGSAAAAEIAVASACGIRVRGVAVCPMPRKSDGWPKAIRRAARAQADLLEHMLYPIPVLRARRGESPTFPKPGADHCEPVATRRGDGSWIWSVTVPGLGRGDVEVGSWSADPAYPTTHVVLKIDSRVVRLKVDATLRRCRALEAVVSADSVAVTFAPHEDHWPKSENEEPGHG